ncbi:hypothetical protein [Streptomyces sp.]|uniref:hypothetical protein n=1 Tax=Streptomyces sp. TaxID=1931 RepID=UPI002F40BF28
MSPSPTVTGDTPSAGAPTSVSPGPAAHGEPADRVLPPPADDPSAPRPTTQPSPTAEPPPTAPPSPEPTTDPPTDPPSPTASPDPTGSPET